MKRFCLILLSFLTLSSCQMPNVRIHLDDDVMKVQKFWKVYVFYSPNNGAPTQYRVAVDNFYQMPSGVIFIDDRGLQHRIGKTLYSAEPE